MGKPLAVTSIKHSSEEPRVIASTMRPRCGAVPLTRRCRYPRRRRRRRWPASVLSKAGTIPFDCSRLGYCFPMANEAMTEVVNTGS